MSEQEPFYLPEAESGVLGAILLAAIEEDVGAVEDMVGLMQSSDFYHADNAALFEAILTCREQGMPVDVLTVGIAQRVLPSGALTLGYAAMLTNEVPSRANWRTYAGHVQKMATLRKVVQLGTIATEMRHDQLPTDEIIASCQQAMADLRDLQSGGKAGYKLMADVLPKVLDTMDDVLNDKAPPKLSTGLVDLDKLIGFLRPKSMVVIAGRSGSGKAIHS